MAWGDVPRMTNQVNLANVHVQFNRLHVALVEAATKTNDPALKRWADQIDTEHHEFYDDTRNDYRDEREHA